MQPLLQLTESLNLPSPTIELPILHDHDYQVFIKRDDLIHSDIGGNKWRKLKYNIQAYLQGGFDGIITFGGPFSNHLRATAAVCEALAIPCFGIVRAYTKELKNSTLRDCRSFGMEIVPVSHDLYAQRYETAIWKGRTDLRKPYLIPEGGSNDLALKGCREIISELEFMPDYVFLPIGTAATLAGISPMGSFKVFGVSPFKENKVHIPYIVRISPPFEILYDFSMKGYGRFDSSLVAYINDFWLRYQIPLDPIYNGKAMMALESMIKNKVFSDGSKILFIHTGGLQGIRGFNNIHGHKSKIIIPESIYSPIADQ